LDVEQPLHNHSYSFGGNIDIIAGNYSGCRVSGEYISYCRELQITGHCDIEHSGDRSRYIHRTLGYFEYCRATKGGIAVYY